MLTVVTGNGSVRCLCLHSLAIGRYQGRGHQSQRTKALGQGVRLYIAVVVFTSPDKVSVPLKGRSHHVVDKAVFVGNAQLLKLSFIVLLVNILKNVFETTVVLFKNGVFGRQVQGPLFVDGLVETAVGKTGDALIGIVHGQSHPVALKVVNIVGLYLAPVFRRKSNGELDRKSTRLNSSHVRISYAVFCLKKKK